MKCLVKVMLLMVIVFSRLYEANCYFNINDVMINNFNTRKYSIKLKANGGSFDDYDLSVKYNSTNLPVPKRVGYDFIGYSVDDKVKYYSLVGNIDEINNKELYAKWKTIIYTISYDLNGGSISSDEEISTYNIENETFTLPTPRKEGYDFIGWTGSNGNTPSNVTIEKGSIGNRTYKANWKIKTFTVTYKNTAGSNYASRLVNWNSSVPSLSYSTGVDKIFTGWTYNGSSISGVKVKSNITVQANVRDTMCWLQTGQAKDGNVDRLTYMQSILSQKGVSGRIGYHSEGYKDFVSNNYSYSKILDAGNYLLANSPSTSFPYLRWLGMFCENDYGIQLR